MHKIQEVDHNQQIQYLQSQMAKAHSPEAKALLEQAIAEETVEIQKSNAKQLAAVEAKVNAGWQAVTAEANAAARRSWERGTVDRYYRELHPSHVANETMLGDMSADEFTAAITRARQAFLQALGSAGVQLSVEGALKHRKFLESNDLDLTREIVWMSSLNYLATVGVITPEDMSQLPTVTEEPTPVTPETELSERLAEFDRSIVTLTGKIAAITKVKNRTHNQNRELTSLSNELSNARSQKTLAQQRFEKEDHINGIWREAKTTVLAFSRELNSRGIQPTDEEVDRLKQWILQSGLFPTNPQTWTKALAAVLPHYLDSETTALQKLDRDDSIQSSDLKRVLGTLRPIQGMAVRNVGRD